MGRGKPPSVLLAGSVLRHPNHHVQLQQVQQQLFKVSTCLL